MHKTRNYGAAYLILIPVAITAVISFLLLILSCAVLFNLKDPDALLRPVGVSLLFLTSAASGILSVRINGGNVLYSFVSSVIFTLFLAMISAVLFGKDLPLGQRLALYSSVPAVSVAASYLSVRRRAASRRRKRIARRR